MVSLPGVHAFFGDHILVRLAGIDTPEVKGKCAREKVFLGLTFSSGLAEAITVTSIFDVPRDGDQERSFTALDTGLEQHGPIIWHTVENADAPELNRDLAVTVLLRLDGDQWSALLGENITAGVGGFGDSVNEAVRDLAANVEAEHRNWLEFQEQP